MNRVSQDLVLLPYLRQVGEGVDTSEGESVLHLLVSADNKVVKDVEVSLALALRNKKQTYA